MPQNKSNRPVYSQNIVACIWDFDKTLIPGYMQAPLFDHYNIDGKQFWNEVNQLPDLYNQRGISVSKDTVYLNHLLNHVENGQLKGLNNQILHNLGAQLQFYPGLPSFFKELQDLTQSQEHYRTHNLTLEHYVISTGLAAMIRGSDIAPFVKNIYGCEFVENPFPPGFMSQPDLINDLDCEISQIGVMVDNTIKTRFLFEINKGTNVNPNVDVNAKIKTQDRRIPFENMIYVADGPSDIPVFSVIKDQGGKAFAVYDPESPEEFAQNDMMLQANRIHSYGPADYSTASPTAMWLKMHVKKICDRIVNDRQQALDSRMARPPKHIHKKEPQTEETAEAQALAQGDLL